MKTPMRGPDLNLTPAEQDRLWMGCIFVCQALAGWALLASLVAAHVWLALLAGGVLAALLAYANQVRAQTNKRKNKPQ